MADEKTPDENKPGRVLKVLFFDDKGEPIGEPASTQLPEDPFSGRMDRQGLQAPPFPLEQLLFLAEVHPIHSAAIEQKSTDAVGQGWTWESKNDEASEEERDELEAWFASLARGEQTMHEQLLVAQEDFEKIGQGMFEVVRDDAGNVNGLYHVPAHTCRFHRDGVRIAQIRGEKVVWFKRWGTPVEENVNRVTGALKENVPEDKVANEMLVIQKPSSRSTWYGIPKYISAIGWISLALAVRDDNLLFFANRREPRWAVILSNLEDDDSITEDLRRAFAVDLKSPHRNLLIPISGNGSVKFEKLSNDRLDGSFEKLGLTADAQILVAHRMPPERLGFIKVGNLGGNVALDSSRVYREAVIEPTQTMLNARFNRFIEREYKRDERKQDGKTDQLGWLFTLCTLDLADESEDLKHAVLAFKAGLLRLNEARRRINEDPLDEPAADEIADADLDDAALDDEAASATKSADAGASYYGDKFYFELFSNSAAAASEASDDVEAALNGGGLMPLDGDDDTDVVLRKIDRAIETLLMQEDAE